MDFSTIAACFGSVGFVDNFNDSDSFFSFVLKFLAKREVCEGVHGASCFASKLLDHLLGFEAWDENAVEVFAEESRSFPMQFFTKIEDLPLQSLQCLFQSTLLLGFCFRYFGDQSIGVTTEAEDSGGGTGTNLAVHFWRIERCKRSNAWINRDNFQPLVLGLKLRFCSWNDQIVSVTILQQTSTFYGGLKGLTCIEIDPVLS